MTFFFESARGLIDRALEHVNEMDARFDAFIKHGVGERFVKPDPYSGEQLHGVRITRPIPIRVSVVAYDIVNTLRSSLDHAVFDAAVRLGHQDPVGTKFPFADTLQGVKDDIKKTRKPKAGVVGGIPVEIDQALIDVGAHNEEGGNRTLWAFNKLRNIKNHRRLVEFKFHVSQQTVSNGIFYGGGVTMVSEWNAAKTEFVYLRTPAETQSHHQVHIGAMPAIGDTPVIGGKPAGPFFREVAEISLGVIRGLEAETARILRERGG